jgi:TIR domain
MSCQYGTTSGKQVRCLGLGVADIFISYSKPDRTLALKLSALLESHGYTTWWDTSLEPADKYRDKIMHEIDEARAVISLWTERSVRSDWVRAEADRARGQGKLIPVKASGVSYDAIPLPFGEMHTEPLGNDEKVLGAVKELLEKPQETPSWWRMSWAGARYEILVWSGIIAAISTLITNLSDLIQFAHWAKVLTVYWSDILRAIWQIPLDIIQLRVGRFDAIFLTLVSMLMVILLRNTLKSKSGNLVVSSPIINVTAVLGLFLTITIFTLGAISTQDAYFAEFENLSERIPGRVDIKDMDGVEDRLDAMEQRVQLNKSYGGDILQILTDPYTYFFKGYDVDPDYFSMQGIVLMSVACLMIVAVALYLFLKVAKRSINMKNIALQFWRINIGVALILALNYLSLWLEPQCQPGGVLEKLCGGVV